MTTSSNKKIWYVTGASKGLGLALVRKLIDSGYPVAATSRDASQLVEKLGEHQNFLPLTVDLTSEKSIAASIEATVARFGGLDVLMNNAGYGIGGSLEELDSTEIRDSFEVNVFATINVIKAALPQLRAQQSGHIINIASIAGFNPPLGWATYAATKFAVIGLTEVLAQDVEEFGIKATVVAPGGFRTSFLKQESMVTAANPMPEYTAVRASLERYAGLDGKQTGDPEKAADVFIDLGENPNPPVTLFLGSDAIRRAWDKTEKIQQNIKDWKITSTSTDV